MLPPHLQKKGEGEGTNNFGVVFTQSLAVLAILKRGQERFQSFKGGRGGGGLKSLPCIDGDGGAQNVSDPQFTNFIAPQPPPYR